MTRLRVRCSFVQFPTGCASEENAAGPGGIWRLRAPCGLWRVVSHFKEARKAFSVSAGRFRLTESAGKRLELSVHRHLHREWRSGGEVIYPWVWIHRFFRNNPPKMLNMGETSLSFAMQKHSEKSGELNQADTKA